MYMYINKLGSRSYSYIHSKSSHICIIHLVLEGCYFEAVLPKRRLSPLGIKHTFFGLFLVCFQMRLWVLAIFMKNKANPLGINVGCYGTMECII